LETPRFPGRPQWGEREEERGTHHKFDKKQDHCLQVVAMEDVHGFSIAMFD